MARKRKLKSQESSYTAEQKQPVFIYNDNVTTQITQVLSSENTTHLNSALLGLPINVRDDDYYKRLNLMTSGETTARFVVTSDTGKDILRNIQIYKGRICTILVNISGSENQMKALQALRTTRGFKTLHRLPTWYPKIRLSKNGGSLIIDYYDSRSNEEKRRTVRNVFAA